jgi:hypothetical protein
MLVAAAIRATFATKTAMTLMRSSSLFLTIGCAVLGFVAHGKLCKSLENPNYTPNPEARAIYARLGAPFEAVDPKTRSTAPIAKLTDNEPVVVRKLIAAHQPLP